MQSYRKEQSQLKEEQGNGETVFIDIPVSNHHAATFV